MRDLQLRCLSCRLPFPHAGAERYAASPRAFPCVSLRFSNTLTNSRKFPNPFDKTRHFQTLIWAKWAIPSSFLLQYRHFAIQSLNTPPTPPDISRHLANNCGPPRRQVLPQQRFMQKTWSY